MNAVIKVLVVCVTFGMMTFLIGIYLAPDDLKNCKNIPDENSQIIACKKADAIVAVSGGDTDARTDHAIDLYKRGWADTLIFSGAAADKSGPSNAEAMRKYAIKNGVPANAIVTEENSKTTQENAKLSQEVFSDMNISRVILVTSAYHQRRASIEFKLATGGSVKIDNHPVKQDKQWSDWWWLTPNGWWLAMGEIIKIVVTYAGVPR